TVTSFARNLRIFNLFVLNPLSMKKVILSMLITYMYVNQSFAQQQQLILETLNNIVLETEKLSLAFGIEENKDVNMLYLGRKLKNNQEYSLINNQYKQNHDYTNMYQSAYTASGTRNLLEPAISVEHADGNLSLDLKYVRHEIKSLNDNQKQLTIFLQDEVYPFTVELHYLANYKENVFEQWTNIQHQETGNVKLHKFASANLSLKGNDFFLKSYHGDWIAEMQPEVERITHGIKTLDSK